MKSFGIVILIVGIILGSIVGYLATNEQINSLQNRIQNLEIQVISLQDNKTQLRNQVVSLQNRISSLENDKKGLEKRIPELEAGNVTIKVESIILSVRFSPKGGAASQVIYWLGRANKSIHVLIYSFTLDSIGDAVLGAYQKGIDIKIVFEKSEVSQYSEYFRLADTGVQVRNDTNPALMHHKVAIIDGSIVLVGSFNWSSAAEEDNNENLLVIRSSDLASTFE